MLIDHLDPHRPPDWRWQFARPSAVLECSPEEAHLRSIYLRSDPYLRLAKKAHEYQQKWDRQLFNLAFHIRTGRFPKPPSSKVQLVQHAAQYVSQNRDTLFWLCKAMILGRTPMSMMRPMLGMSRDFLAVMTAIFFDIELRLDDEVFILDHVIGSDPKVGLRDAEGLWQECAYFGGYWRMLYLGAKGNWQDVKGLYRSVREQKPTLMEYLDAGKVSKEVLSVVKARMEPNPKRNLADLRQLYLTLPDWPASSGPKRPERKNRTAPTYFEIIDVLTGERKRQAAELL